MVILEDIPCGSRCLYEEAESILSSRHQGSGLCEAADPLEQPSNAFKAAPRQDHLLDQTQRREEQRPLQSFLDNGRRPDGHLDGPTAGGGLKIGQDKGRGGQSQIGTRELPSIKTMFSQKAASALAEEDADLILAKRLQAEEFQKGRTVVSAPKKRSRSTLDQFFKRQKP